jgi:ureidoglycolate lyase
MKSYRLKLKPLTDETFAPFGEVIQRQGHYPEEINYGQTRKYADLARIDTTEEEGRTAVHIYRSRPVSLPFKIEVLECHLLGSQAFIPLHNHPFLIVVAPPAEQPEFKSIQGFITNGQQGVNLHRGVWHHHQLSLEETCDYLVIERSAPGVNTIEQHLNENLFIEEL